MRDLAAALDREQFDVRFYYLAGGRGPFAQEIADLGYQVESLHWRNGFSLAGRRRLLRALLRFRPMVVHDHLIPPLTRPLVSLALRCPVLHTEHGGAMRHAGDEDDGYLLFFGRLEPIKGLRPLLGACRLAPEVRLILAGRVEEPLASELPRVLPPDASFPGVELVRVPVLRGKHSLAPSLFLASALHALVRRRFDLVHVHDVEACFVLPLLKAKYGVIATSHGQAYSRDKWGGVAKALIRAADWPYIRLADCVTSVSKPLSQYYAKRYHRTVHHIPNGVSRDEGDVDLAEARDLLGAHGVEPGDYVLFAAGRIIPIKGAHLVLQAFRGLTTELNLLIVGDTSQVPSYEEKLRQLADSRVAFVPTVDRANLFGLVRLARFFVFPSTVEGMSMMLLEVASLGTPLVSSDIPENTTVLPQHALFFKSGDADDLRRKLDWALHHDDEMRDLGRKAKGWVMKNYHWDSIVGKYEALHHHIV